MAKPILLAVDDDVSVLETVVQDLRRKYGKEHRILRAASGQAALDICRQLKERNDVVALILSDQRMPGMTGVDFLEQAIKLYPDAKRVLLTAYADTEAAIRAINSARIHYYLNKPWDPPEEKLYPVLDDLLTAWNDAQKKSFDGLQLISTRWGAGDHEIRNFLSRNLVPFQWLDPEKNPECLQMLCDRNIGDGKLPVVLFPDGTSLIQPEINELASKLPGMRTQSASDHYDVVVAGAGPAGLAAAVYGASEGLRTLVIDSLAPGGQAGSSSKIENYLGFSQGISGERLAKEAFIQAGRLGAEFITQRVCSISTDNGYHRIKMADGREVTCRVCIIATGVDYVKLDIPGEQQFSGCRPVLRRRPDRSRRLRQPGGLHRGRRELRRPGRDVLLTRRHARPHAGARRIARAQHEPLLDRADRRDAQHLGRNPHARQGAEGQRPPAGDRARHAGRQQTRPASSVFVFIGAAPKTAWLPEGIARDPKGFVLAGPDLKTKAGSLWKYDRDPYLLETTIPGIFVAGDVRFGSVKRVASSVGEGSIAIQFVHQYLATL